VENLGWGLQMMALGMGLVFGLLALLWGLLTLVLRFDREPQAAGVGAPPTEAGSAADDAPDPAAPVQPAPRVATVEGMDADLVAAILIAVLRHKEVRRAQAAPAMRSYWPGSLLYASRWVASGRARQNTTFERRGR
jgi:Na+-transporting methylmalonyl-CoA/oxaloacetate decarboxylase gamma subunit